MENRKHITLSKLDTPVHIWSYLNSCISTLELDALPKIILINISSRRRAIEGKRPDCPPSTSSFPEPQTKVELFPEKIPAPPYLSARAEKKHKKLSDSQLR